MIRSRALRRVLGPVLVVALFAILTFSCEEVKEMDDNASVSKVSVTGVLPSQAVFTTPVVKEDRIVLPSDFGKYLFPLTVTLDVVPQQIIDKILGFDSETSLIFETPQSIRKIHLIAVSGVVHTYSVSIEVAPRSEEADITSCILRSFTPAEFMLAPQPKVNKMESRVDFYGVASDLSFPVLLDLDMKCSEGAALEGYTPGVPIRFDNYGQRVTVNVVASSGKTKTWTLCLTKANVVDAPSQVGVDAWERMALYGPYLMDFPDNQVIVRHLYTNDETGTLTYQLESTVPFPWQASFAYALDPYAQAIGLPSGARFDINGWQDSKTFYVLDNIDAVARKWTLSWERWLSPHNLVLSFVPEAYSGTGGEVKLAAAVIDTLTSTVSVPLESGMSFPIEVTRYEASLSEGAQMDLPPTLTFLSHNTAYEFTVTAQNGAQRIWKLVMDPWYSTAHQVESFTVKSYHSQERRVVFESPEALIDKEKAQLNLVLKSGYDFPLVIEDFDVILSEDASLVEDYSHGITFETPQDKIPLTVRAQSRDEQTWTLSLTDERKESLEAMVEAFYVEQYKGTTTTSHNLKMENWGAVDTLSRTITLTVTDWSNKLPLVLTPTIAVSKNATYCWDGLFGKSPQLIFNTLEDTYDLLVCSESGTVTTRWQVRLKDISTPRSHEANVLNFITGNAGSEFEFDTKYLEQDKHLITLLVSLRPSADAVMTIAPRITVSENARLQGITSGAGIDLTFDNPYSFDVMAQDESITRWTIRLIYAPQVYNNGFENWGTVDGTYNLYPADGTGWTTGNNTQVSGTSRAEGYNSPSASQMTTWLKTMNLVVYKVTSLASGATFLGDFTLKISVDDVAHPTNMSNFGIPFRADVNPIGFEVDYKYTSGGQRTFTEPKTNSVIPAFRDPVNWPGPDMGIIATEIHYLPSGTWNYVFGNADATRIAQAEFYTTGASQWTRQRCLFTTTAGRGNLKMTHLVVRMSSSYEGYYFKGAHGSTLTVDNFKLIYYDPSADAVVLE